MIGIYKITNKINGHSYIGQSKDIELRWKTHKNRAFCETDKEYDKALYRAFRKYGIDNFKFEVLEANILEKDLNDKEKYYIEKYNTFHNGYNASPGGDNPFERPVGEKHPKATMTNEDVYRIRERYNNHELQSDVYKDYSHLIGSSGFKKIWNGSTWKNIHMDVYTKENKEYFNYIRNSKSNTNTNIEYIISIRKRLKAGENQDNIYLDYSFMDKTIFKKICNYKTYKHIIV